MLDVSFKQNSLRKAVATGKVLCDPFIIERIKNNTLPKGNLLDIATAAGLLASKNTAHLIPHCHPVDIDNMEITYEIDEKGVTIHCSGKSVGRTGIEMEVLTAVSVAALTIYDLLKPLKGNLEITGIRLLEKKGGKSQIISQYVKEGVTAAVLVCSDSTAAGTRKDKSGLVIKEMLGEYNVEIADYAVVPDEPLQIQEKLRSWSEKGIQFIFTTGGTGLGPRDRTVEAVKEILDREASGITEAMRGFGQQRTAVAMLSRAVAGVLGKTLIVTLPGSSNGARECLNGILPAVIHSASMIRGGGHDD